MLPCMGQNIHCSLLWQSVYLHLCIVLTSQSMHQQLVRNVCVLLGLMQCCVCDAESATADVVVRLRANPGAVSPAELRVAIIGNVDSGKSTMVSTAVLPTTASCYQWLTTSGAARYAVLSTFAIYMSYCSSISKSGVRLCNVHDWAALSGHACTYVL